MDVSFARLRSEAQALEPDQRAQLALDLLESLEGSGRAAGVEQAWNEEAARRLAQFDRGALKTISADEFHADDDLPHSR